MDKCIYIRGYVRYKNIANEKNHSKSFETISEQVKILLQMPLQFRIN